MPTCLCCGNLNSEKSICKECSTKKICNICKKLLCEDQFYINKKTTKLYSRCKECFNKKIECSICNRLINNTHLKRHIEMYVRKDILLYILNLNKILVNLNKILMNLNKILVNLLLET